MRFNNFLIYLILLWIASLFGNNVHAAPNEKVASVQVSVQYPQESNCTVSQHKTQEIVLSPFFQLQNKGDKTGIERIVVTLLMKMPTDSAKYDFNSPAFRKMFFDLLQSGKPEYDIQSQALDSLTRQLGFTIDAAVQLSRSFIIVH